MASPNLLPTPRGKYQDGRLEPTHINSYMQWYPKPADESICVFGSNSQSEESDWLLIPSAMLMGGARYHPIKPGQLVVRWQFLYEVVCE